MNNDYLKRVLSGFIYITLFSVSIFAGHIYLNIYFLMLIIVGLYEFANIINFKGIHRWVCLYMLSISIFVMNYLMIVSLETFINTGYIIFLSFLLFIFVYFILELFSKDSNFLKNIGGMIIPILILILPLCLLIQISFFQEEYNPYIIFYFLLSIWVSDTFAFLVGRFFGKIKIFKRISPQKTLEGYIGALIFTLIFSFSFHGLFANYIEVLDKMHVWLGICLIVFIFGSIGDLVESKFKREAKVKDSGTIIVGHG